MNKVDDVLELVGIFVGVPLLTLAILSPAFVALIALFGAMD